MERLDRLQGVIGEMRTELEREEVDLDKLTTLCERGESVINEMRADSLKVTEEEEPVPEPVSQDQQAANLETGEAPVKAPKEEKS